MPQAMRATDKTYFRIGGPLSLNAHAITLGLVVQKLCRIFDDHNTRDGILAMLVSIDELFFRWADAVAQLYCARGFKGERVISLRFHASTMINGLQAWEGVSLPLAR